jgi:type I restriction enzyme S subunit
MSENYVLPENWLYKKLGDIAEVTSSKRVFESDWKTDGVPFYRAREIVKLSKQGFIENEIFISEQMFEEYSKKYGKPQKNDIMITGVGTLGVCYLVKENDRFYFKDGNIIWVKNICDFISSNYLFYILTSELIQKQIKTFSAGNTVGTYTIENAKRTIIPYPPIDEQKRITKIIETKLTAVEKAKKASTEQLANCALLINRFYENLFEEFTSKYELGNYCSIVNGSTPKTGIDEYWSGNIVWITPTDLGKNKYKYICNSERRISKSGYNSANTTIIEKNNIILSTRAPIGHIAINNVEACTNQGCKSILPNNELNVDFLYYYLKYNKDKLDELGSGTTFKELSTSSLISFKIPVPSITEQEHIVSIFEMKLNAIEKIISYTTAQSSYINALPSSILRKAFNGEY